MKRCMKSPSHKLEMIAYATAKKKLGLASLFSQMVRSCRWLRKRVSYLAIGQIAIIGISSDIFGFSHQ